jgi:hypothetical protein
MGGLRLSQPKPNKKRGEIKNEQTTKRNLEQIYRQRNFPRKSSRNRLSWRHVYVCGVLEIEI